MLNFAVLKMPKIFDEHVHSRYLETPKHKRMDGYFLECVYGAREVFSRSRVEHLLSVRDFYVKNKEEKESAISQKKDGFVFDGKFRPAKNLNSYFQDEGFDLSKARIALGFEIYDIAKESDYLIKAVDWAESKVPQLFLPYAISAFKKSISNDERDWCSNYFDIQTEYLGGNFSKERYLHLIKVRQYLRDKGVEGFVPSQRQKTASFAESEMSRQAEPKASQPAAMPPSDRGVQPGTTSRALRAALMVGGAVAALVVLVFSMTR